MNATVGVPVWLVLAAGAAATQPPPAHQAVGYPSLFLLVALGSIVPVIPTGAVVSAAAVVAWHAGTPYDLPLVLAVATVAALAGDTALYWMATRGGGRWWDRLRAGVDTPRLNVARHRLAEHGTAVVVLSRLLPAGRLPVMVACLVSGWPVRRYVRADLVAALAWATGYLMIGVLGGSLFAEPWQGLVAVVALALLATAVPALWRWSRRLTGGSAEPRPQPLSQPEDRPAH